MNNGLVERWRKKETLFRTNKDKRFSFGEIVWENCMIRYPTKNYSACGLDQDIGIVYPNFNNQIEQTTKKITIVRSLSTKNKKTKFRYQSHAVSQNEDY